MNDPSLEWFSQSWSEAQSALQFGRHSGTRGAGPESIIPVSARDAGTEIDPPGVFLFDQTDLPVTPPFLQFFFACDSGYRSS
jgi:hypothetical protein